MTTIPARVVRRLHAMQQPQTRPARRQKPSQQNPHSPSPADTSFALTGMALAVALIAITQALPLIMAVL